MVSVGASSCARRFVAHEEDAGDALGVGHPHAPRLTGKIFESKHVKEFSWMFLHVVQNLQGKFLEMF